ncbi:hypothetical protein [Segatella oulorum]|nr:hypothetical protein [Segatella oulorum]
MWYQQQPELQYQQQLRSCDLLENIYLCGINNNKPVEEVPAWAL